MMITNTDINTYKSALIMELRRLGACATEIRMVTEDMIIECMTRDLRPCDVAWNIIE